MNQGTVSPTSYYKLSFRLVRVIFISVAEFATAYVKPYVFFIFVGELTVSHLYLRTSFCVVTVKTSETFRRKLSISSIA